MRAQNPWMFTSEIANPKQRKDINGWALNDGQNSRKKITCISNPRNIANVHCCNDKLLHKLKKKT